MKDYNEIINSCEKQAQAFHDELEKANHKLDKIKQRFLTMNFQLTALDKSVKSAVGTISLQRGIQKENHIRQKIRLMVEKKQHMFADCELQGDVHSINIRGSKGTGCEIDVYAKLSENKEKKRTFALLAEVKNYKRKKVGIGLARKFLSTVKRAKETYQLEDIVTVYISVSGFTKDAQEYLENARVKIASSEQVFID